MKGLPNMAGDRRNFLRRRTRQAEATTEQLYEALTEWLTPIFEAGDSHPDWCPSAHGHDGQADSDCWCGAELLAMHNAHYD